MTAESLRQQVFRYIEDHPSLFKLKKKEQNIKLCEAFGAIEENEQNTIKHYKHAYLDLLEEQRNMGVLRESLSREKKAPLKQPKQKTTTTANPLPLKDPGFIKFAKWLSIPAYKGLLKWQIEHHLLTWDAIYEMTLVMRNAGKSVAYTEKYEWAMQYQEFDVLVLGWTDRRKEVALYVYNFFSSYDLIEVDKRTSPFHFRLKNGGKFDCYLITSKETLGMHSEGLQNRFDNMSEADWVEYKGLFEVDIDTDGERSFDEIELKEYVESRKGSNRKLWISIDDPIDSSFMKERHKEATLELHFNSSLYPIHPDKWSFTGTHKFEGDFFDFIKAKFGRDLVEYIHGVWNEDGTLFCPELFTHPDIPTYNDDIMVKKMDLDRIRTHVGEYTWWSEYEQKPHAIQGEYWDHLALVDLVDTPLDRKHDICFITIDRATTEKVKSNYTGCFVGLREIETGCRIITHDWTEKIPLEQLLIKVNNFLILFRAMHEHITILIFAETQGGGSDFITMARTRVEFWDKGKRIPNRIPEIAGIVEIHNVGEKIQRIKDRITAPITNERIKFMSTLIHSEGVQQLLNFPNNPNFDAPDCLANAEFLLLKYPIRCYEGYAKEIEEVYRRYSENKLLEDNSVREVREARDVVSPFPERFGERKRTVF